MPHRLLVLAALLTAAPAAGQEIVIRADAPQHVFEGAGASFGLFLNNYVSASPTAQNELVRLIAQELDLSTIQEYNGRGDLGLYPGDDPAYFDRRADFVKAIRAVRPGVEFSLVTNMFPDDLRKDLVLTGRDGVERTYRVLDTDDPDIYDKLADWYFQLFQAFDARGVSVEVLNVVNEPDLLVCGQNLRQCRTHHYGYDGDTRRGVAEIFAQAVPAFKALLADPSVNTTGMPVPRIMGPSTFAPGGSGSAFQGGAVDYVQYLKTNHADAWDQIDIVSTHQYDNGVRGDLFQTLRTLAGGKPLHQSETHGSKQFGPSSLRANHRTALSLAQLFGASVNFGTSMWSYFQTNYPNPADPDDADRFNPGGLVSLSPPQIPDPEPLKHYSVFRQLTSAQPDSSSVLDYTASSGRRADVVAFRKGDRDSVYVSVTNTSGTPQDVTISVEDAGGLRVIETYSVRTTDATRDDDETARATLDANAGAFTYTMGPYSVNTFTVGLGSATVDAETVPEASVALLPPAPNPARGAATIAYRLAAPVEVELAVSDALGRRVRQLDSGPRGAGPHRSVLSTAGLAPGVYLVTLRAGDAVATRRITVVR